MDRCTKFKVFNCLLLLCVANFLLYRYFNQPATIQASVTPNSNRLYNNPKNSSLQRNQPSPDIAIVKLPSVHNSSNVLEPLITSKNESNKPEEESSFVSSMTLPLCPLVPPRLNGPLATYSEASNLEDIAAENAGLQRGGRFKPPDCTARHRVAIIIPYRNRPEHLKILLKNLHPILGRQQLDYGIYVIDQALPGKFNRAMLMNIGYAEAMKRYDYQCAIFHDVDLIPENDRNIYSCPEQPRHLSAAIDKFNYRLPYDGIYGGVSAINKEHFEKINGFSNMFFGWGGEDDDMASRIRHAGLSITRYPMEIARYRMIKHSKDSGNEQNPQRFALLKTTTQRMATDGLNSLVYTVQGVEELPTHLRISVYINETLMLNQQT
ncbi:beta-1,4-N-acetylgalactosaminyltransferase bre-4-like [Biomphalaria glabrata]|uniref:Beta-1,4-galactosyltransferase n=1 Tax=Biomphalaria glabrata TaxID=6526 RepID=A0A2C9JMS5_BIOGL|nr:beta-1,4-N-acetylgalactosaminyltransferase bre-4-like [Biomphalaria glabrata]XP_013073730.1 beta-1,4-N-acetylgalactosaminyltransferase bre-4-like [Biomphalaria glabrata]XP_055890045.1 beta-1,4-N-acetylgalactosaminyltransferase bre-4-like [Biomphalaria glabrata]XP_055890046.1 beta-1,4-N-acetylgalactosaminyltransferase bre-4-like [Biomphalaria glabrata]